MVIKEKNSMNSVCKTIKLEYTNINISIILYIQEKEDDEAKEAGFDEGF
jgi:hypothetical protein